MSSCSKLKLIRVTEVSELPINSIAWGAVPSYTLESVKINLRNGSVRSAAVITIKDKSGRATVLFEGLQVGTLLGFNSEQWEKIEKMSSTCELFYRPFKKGVNSNFPLEQRIFYAYCQYYIKRDALCIKFQKSLNVRKDEKDVPFLKVLHCTLPTVEVMKQYNFNENVNLQSV